MRREAASTLILTPATDSAVDRIKTVRKHQATQEIFNYTYCYLPCCYIQHVIINASNFKYCLMPLSQD